MRHSVFILLTLLLLWKWKSFHYSIEKVIYTFSLVPSSQGIGMGTRVWKLGASACEFESWTLDAKTEQMMIYSYDTLATMAVSYVSTKSQWWPLAITVLPTAISQLDYFCSMTVDFLLPGLYWSLPIFLAWLYRAFLMIIWTTLWSPKSSFSTEINKNCFLLLVTHNSNW